MGGGSDHNASCIHCKILEKHENKSFRVPIPQTMLVNILMFWGDLGLGFLLFFFPYKI